MSSSSIGILKFGCSEYSFSVGVIDCFMVTFGAKFLFSAWLKKLCSSLLTYTQHLKTSNYIKFIYAQFFHNFIDLHHRLYIVTIILLDTLITFTNGIINQNTTVLIFICFGNPIGKLQIKSNNYNNYLIQHPV